MCTKGELCVTKIGHGQAAADVAKKTAEDIFEGGGKSEDMVTYEISKADLESGIQLADVLASSGMVKSKGEGKRMIAQKGITLNDQTVEDQFYVLSGNDFDDKGEAVCRKGKKMYRRLIIV